MLALLPACSVTPSSPGRRSPRGGIWAQGDSCVTQQPPRFTCHCVLLVLNLSAAVTGGEGPSFSGQLHHRLPWTTSSSALMKILLYLPFKKTTFVSPPQEKTPGERSASNQSDFSSLLCVFFGCSSGLCFTPCTTLPSTLWSLPDMQGMDRQGWALLPGCLVQVEVTNGVTEFICAALQVSHTWGL